MFSGMIPEVVVELAQILARDWLPGDLKRTIFINTGSRRSEVALRMAKMYTDGYEVLALGGPGTASPAARVLSRWRAIVRAMACRRPGLRHPRAQRLSALTFRASPRNRRPSPASISRSRCSTCSRPGAGAAIIVEPVISAGGVLVPPQSFMQALRKAADDRGMLLIFDEAQTAFGRIGTRTGSEH